MKRERILLILGVWEIILPFLGFPNSWKNILFSVSGAGLIYISFLIYREMKEKEVKEIVFDNFSENDGSNDQASNDQDKQGF